MITLDLRNLTEEMIDEATPFMGACSYRAPCIIGTLMTPEERQSTTGSIHTLMCNKEVEFPNRGQAAIAERLQFAFDMADYGPEQLADYNAVLDEVRALRDTVKTGTPA